MSMLVLALLVLGMALPFNSAIIKAAPTCTDICYVAVDGDDNNAGDEANPLLTIGAALSQVNAGGTIHIGAGTFTETVVINKTVTLSGAGADNTIITAPSGTANQKLFDVQANDVIIEAIQFWINQPDAATGIYAADPNPFNNITIRDNKFYTTGSGARTFPPSPFPVGATDAVAIALLSRNAGNSATISDNEIIAADSATDAAVPFYGRAIWMYNIAATVTGNSIDGALAADIAHQTPSGASTIDGNQLLSTGLLLVGMSNGSTIDVTNNTFDQATIEAFNNPAFQPPHSIAIRNNVNGIINIDGNTFLNHKIGVLSGASQNVTVTNNTFTPAAARAGYEYSHILFDSGYETNGTMVRNTANSITIQGNTFNGSDATGRALDFQNSSDTGSGFGAVVVGGSATAEQNIFQADLAQFVRFTDAIEAPSPVNPAGANISPAAFPVDVEGAYNQYYLPSNPSNAVLGLELNDAQLSEIAALINDDLDNSDLGLYHLTDGNLVASESSLTFQGPINATLGPQTFEVQNALSSVPALNASLSNSEAWLTCSPSSLSGLDSTAQTISCQAATTGLAAGVYSDTVVIAADSPSVAAPAQVEVTLTVEGPCTTTCYVATTGSDSNTGGPTDPFLTITAALAQVDAEGTVVIAAGSYTEAVVISKAVTIQGAGADNTIITAPSGTNQKLFHVQADDVTIEGIHFAINQPDAATGIYAADPNSFNNITIKDNKFTTTGSGALTYPPSPFPVGRTQASAITLLSTVSNPSATITGNTVTVELPNDYTQTPFYGRAIWLYNITATITGNSLDGALAADIVYQSPAGTSIIDNNELLSTGLLLVSPANGSISVSNNTFDQATMQAFDNPAFQPPHSIAIRDNVNATITIDNNTFLNHQIGVLSGSSTKVSVSNNTFTPAAARAGYDYSHILFDTGYETSGQAVANSANSITVKGNTFNGSDATGRALDFQNSTNTGSGFGTVVVGGSAAADQNIFKADLAQFVRFTDAIEEPSPVNPAGDVSPAAFPVDVEGAYNQYYLPSAPSTALLGSDLNLTQYAEISDLINDKNDNTDLGLYHLTDGVLSASVNSLSFEGNPDQTLLAQSFTVSNAMTGLPGISATAIPSQPWLVCAPNTLTNVNDTPQTITCQVNTAGLTPGNYTALVDIAAASPSIAKGTLVTVNLTVIAVTPPEAAALSLDQTSLSFSATEGDTDPVSGTVTLSNSGATGSPEISLAITGAEDWLTCTLASSDPLAAGTSTVLTCVADPSDLAAGTYTSTLTVAASSADNSAVQNGTQTITVTLVVNAEAGTSGSVVYLPFINTAD
jgi:hypothetical protein